VVVEEGGVLVVDYLADVLGRRLDAREVLLGRVQQAENRLLLKLDDASLHRLLTVQAVDCRLADALREVDGLLDCLLALFD